MNVMLSMTNVVVSTTVSTPLISLSLLVPSSEAVSRRCMALRWWLTASAMSEAKVMTPRPPICTEMMSTAWPNMDQWLVVFTIEMPHVDNALTAVKNAVENDVDCPSCVEMGNSSSDVDRHTSTTK